MTTRTEQFPVAGPVRLRLTTVDANVTVEESDGRTVEVTIVGSGDVDLQPCVVFLESGVLVVEVPPLMDPNGPSGFTFSIGSRAITLGGHHPRLSLTVSAPAGSSATILTRSGDVDVQVPVDELRVESGSGDITVEAAAAAVLKTGSGDLRVESAGELNAHAGSGDVDVESAGKAVLGSGSGDITVESCEGELMVSTGSGDVDVESAGGAATVKSGSGDITVGGIRAGRVAAHTASGDVNLTVVDGVPVWTDVSTVSGDIQNDLSARGEPTEGQAHIELVVRTVSGDITVADD